MEYVSAQFKPNSEFSPVWIKVGSDNLDNWKGVKYQADAAALPLPGKASYRCPDGKKGWYDKGLQRANDGVIDAAGMYGISLNINLTNELPFELKLTIKIPSQPGRHNLLDSTIAVITLNGKGWQNITVPFTAFDYPVGQQVLLKYVKELVITGKYQSNNKGIVLLKNVKFIKGNPIALTAPVQSKPGGADSVIQYQVSVSNSSSISYNLNLSFHRTGWEGMEAGVYPKTLTLQPGETKELSVKVKVPALAPPGSQETQLLQAYPVGSSLPVAKLELISLRRLTGPYLIHDNDGWANVLANTQRYDWAKKQLGELVTAANEFEVPETYVGGIPSDQGTPAVFKSYLEQKFWPVAIAYKLTGEKKYAEKIALLLKRLADPAQGYPSTLHANSQGIPQEGGFWEGACRSYDLIKEAGVLSNVDKELIERSFRLYITETEAMMGDGGISNWSVFNLAPAAMCALVIQDLHHFNYLLNGPTGLIDQLRYGMLDDGWWYEMSLSYNLGCAQAFTSMGLAARAFGIDVLNQKFPVSLTQKVGLRPFEFENFQGMAFGKFGPLRYNYVNIKRMWDGIVKFPDYRGVMFGMGDGHESEVGGNSFELAYFAFRDTSYAAIIKQGKKRDLIFAIPELPDNTPKLYSLSAHADNAGLAVMRSQTAGREQKDQIQAVLKYGTHGSYHGHFDRLSLVSLMRYGRSFWNPETSWYGYGSYMYKWWVQPSMSHNMVVVDGKQQEPNEAKPLLYYSGKMMQVVAAENHARWSNPPYFGGYDQLERVKKGDAPYVPIPTKKPQVTEVTAYTEQVTQRRMLIVTDDYMVLADNLKAQNEHTFDNLLQLRGAKVWGNVPVKGHTAQFDQSPLSTGQFITNVFTYKANGNTKVTSILRAGNNADWGTGGYNHNQEPGVLNVDVWSAWPKETDLLIADYAESWPVNKKLKYEIIGDDQLITADSLGTWILGQGKVEANITNVKTLQLKTYTNRKANTLNTLFWANVKFTTKSGKEIFLSDLHPAFSNIIPVDKENKDYKGGPVRIAGENYTYTTPAEPQNIANPGVINIDLTGVNAVKLTGIVGGDWVVGDEEQLRKTVSFRTYGRHVSYLTLIEPYESKGMVKKVTATGASEMMVELADGRTQRIKIEHFDEPEANTMKVKIFEELNGKISRKEETINQQEH